MPPPPAICEEWWGRTEDFVKRRSKLQPKFGLGYRDIDAYDGDAEDPCDNRAHCCTTATTGDGAGCSYREVATIETEEELDAMIAPEELEDGGQPTIDELVEINLGTEDDPRPIFVNALLSDDEREDYKSFLMEF